MFESVYEEKIAELDQRARQQQIADEEKLEELKRKNHDFVQFTRKGLDALANLDNLLAYKLFLYLSKEMDRENAVVISQSLLAKKFNVTRQYINKAIGILRDKKLIDIYKVGNINIYTMNAYVVWTTSRDKIETARFKANVVLDKEEQEPTETKAKKFKHITEKK